MYKNILPAALLMVSVSLAVAQDDISQAKWQPTAITIDGSNNEWVKPFNLYAGSTGLMFSIANDSSSLYLCFTGNDEIKMRKMMHAGWKLELSSKEKNKKFSASVTFPVRQSGLENKSATNTGWRAHRDFGSLVNSYKLQFTTVTVAGFRTTNGILPSFNNDGIKVNVGDDSMQGVIYEIAIPLKEIFDTGVLQLNEQLTLNVTVNAMHEGSGSTNLPEGERSGVDGGGWGSAGQSRADGGLGRMNPAGNTGEDFGESEEHRSMHSEGRNAMFDSASFKQKFRLAVH